MAVTYKKLWHLLIDRTVHADFKKKGQTELIINTPDGTTKRYDLNIELFSYEIKEK